MCNLRARDALLRAQGDSSSESQTNGWGDEGGNELSGSGLDDSSGGGVGGGLFGGGGLFSPARSAFGGDAFAAPSDSGGGVSFGGFGALDRSRSDGSPGDSRLLKSLRSQSEPANNDGGPE